MRTVNSLNKFVGFCFILLIVTLLHGGELTVNPPSAAADVSCSDCVALGTETSGNYAGSGSEGGAATTATALAANGANCSAGSYPLGVDASGASESCTATGNSSIWLSSTIDLLDTGVAKSFAVQGTSTPDDTTSTQMRPNATITFTNFSCAVLTAVPGAGKSWTISLDVGGSASALSVTISEAEAVSAVDTDSVVVTGDGTSTTRINYTSTPSGTPTASRMSCTIRASNT